MLMARFRAALCGASSTLTRTTLSFPAWARASLSIVGPTSRQGPHQGAQKSTSTGTLASSACSKARSSTSTIQRRGVLQTPQRTTPFPLSGIRFVLPQAGQATLDAMRGRGRGGNGRWERTGLSCQARRARRASRASSPRRRRRARTSDTCSRTLLQSWAPLRFHIEGKVACSSLVPSLVTPRQSSSADP